MIKIGFIGAGNMGFPLLIGAMKAFGKEAVCYTTATKEKREKIKKETGISYCSSNEELVKECKYILLAVKPQYFSQVYDEIKSYITQEHVIISIAAGITIENLKQGLGKAARVIRTMPNTPAMVGEGMTCICYSDDEFTMEEKEMIQTLFTAVGTYEIIPESLMNAAICANGSSPAYVYMFIEALADSVVKYGLSRDKAYHLVAQTVLGSAKMVLETKEHPGRLKDNVCSPGGTTIAGVAALEEYGLRNSVIKATDACYQKAAAMNSSRNK